MTHAPSTLLTVLGLLACGSLRVDETFSEPGTVRLVRVRWASGDVQVRAGATEAVRVHASAWGPEAPLALTHRRDDEILVVELRCQSPAPCGGTLDLDVPAGVAFEADLGEGSVDLDGPLGDLSVIVGSGSIRADALASEEAVLQVVRGSAEAAWSRAPRRVVLASVEGDVTARVPPGTYDVQSAGREPRVTGGLVDDPASPNVLRVTALDGDAAIEAAGPVADAGFGTAGGLVVR